MRAQHYSADCGTADATFMWHRWQPFCEPGRYQVCLLQNAGEGFCDWGMTAVVDDFGNLVRVPAA